MATHAGVARDRLGALLGGDEGAGLRAAAVATLRAQRVVAPEKFAAMIAPGIDAAEAWREDLDHPLGSNR